MTKPDFTQMTRKKLQQYILVHPSDDDAIREFVLNRRGSNPVIYPPPSTLPYEEVEAIFRKKIQSKKIE